MRVRIGELTQQQILWASWLGDPAARILEPEPIIEVECQCPRAFLGCFGTSPRLERPKVCGRCKGTKKVTLSEGVVAFAGLTRVPTRLLIAWAADCAERGVIALKGQRQHPVGRYRLPTDPKVPLPTPLEVTIEMVRSWLRTGTLPSELFARANERLVNHATRQNLYAYGAPTIAASLANAAIRAETEGSEIEVRRSVAGIISDTYTELGCKRDEREWQTRRIIQYLLGLLEVGAV